MSNASKPLWRRILPKNNAEKVAFVAAVTEVVVVALFEAVVILPKIYGHFTMSYWIHFALGLFVWLNAVGNLFMSVLVDLSSGQIILPSILKPGWRYCPFCQVNAPPRSYHCLDCCCCVLKRDHHCLFTGKCIGHNNMRYYMMMVFYLSMGALYCNYINMDYALEMIGTLSWRGVITMFIPMLGWFLGDHTTMSFFACVQCGICFLSFFQFIVLFYFHLTLIIRGQTTYEWRKGEERKYDLGWKQNLIAVFGRNWRWIWVFPLIRSPLPHDGINFPEANGNDQIKSM